MLRTTTYSAFSFPFIFSISFIVASSTSFGVEEGAAAGTAGVEDLKGGGAVEKARNNGLTRKIILFCFVFVQAPYVDVLGDHDPGLKRGRPLTLNEEKYVSLQKLVASHKLAHEVSRLREWERATILQIIHLDFF